MMHRIQVVLDDPSRQALSWLLADYQQPMSQLVRNLVIKEAKARRQADGKISAVEALRQAVARVKKLGPSRGPKDFAVHHDQYLY